MNFLSKKTNASLPIIPVKKDAFDKWLGNQDKRLQNQVKSAGYTGAPGSFLLVHDDKGNTSKVLFGVAADTGLYTYADLAGRLPKNTGGYYIDKKMSAEKATQAAPGWALGR